MLLLYRVCCVFVLFLHLLQVLFLLLLRHLFLALLQHLILLVAAVTVAADDALRGGRVLMTKILLARIAR